jgi:hypothetical protein
MKRRRGSGRGRTLFSSSSDSKDVIGALRLKIRLGVSNHEIKACGR